MDKKKDAYKIELRCANCGYKWVEKIPKGKPVEENFLWGCYIDTGDCPVERMKCPRCECCTVHKNW